MESSIQNYREILLDTVPLTDGLNQSRRLSPQGLWRALRIRLTVVTANSGAAPSGLSRFEFLAALNRLTLRAGGKQIFDVIPGEIYRHQMFLSCTRPERVSQGTSAGTSTYSFEIPFALPYPFDGYTSWSTAMPAGAIPNIELQVQCPNPILGTIYTSTGAMTLTSAQITVSAVQADMDVADLAELVASRRLHGYLQYTITNQLTATGTFDQLLIAGDGVMVDLFTSFSMASTLAFADNGVDVTQVLVGSNDVRMDSRFFEIQNKAREKYRVADPVIYTGLNTTGAWIIPFAPNGELGEGVDLHGEQSLRLRQNVSTLTNNNGLVNTIQGLWLPDAWSQVANVAVA